MVSGHSYLPNDRDFGCVDTARRKQQHIFVPDDWFDLVVKARHINPFVVVCMSCADFVSVSHLTENITNRLQIFILPLITILSIVTHFHNGILPVFMNWRFKH